MNPEKQDISHPKLSEELIQMHDQDQKLRKNWSTMIKSGKTGTEAYNELTRLLIATDRSNTKRMKVLIDTYGWPNYSCVGKQANICAWGLVQHADRDPLFQIKCLPLLKEEVDKSESDPRTYAYLYDRVQIAKGKKQLYATQSSTNNGLYKGEFQPIEDEANVQNRRSQLEVDPHISEYAKLLGFNYVLPSPEEAIVRAQNYQKRYEEQISLAHKAMEKQDYLTASTHYKMASASYGSMKPIDFVEMARSISLSKDEKKGKIAAFYLIKAVLGGWEQTDSFVTNPDFQFSKENNLNNWWECLTRVISELKNN